MADDDYVNYYNADAAESPLPSPTHPPYEEFYSIGNATDDDFSNSEGYNDDYNINTNNNDDDSTKSWLDSLLSNTDSSNNEVQLTPVEDVNPDNVLATLIFNTIVCIILMGLYELLRRWIPSVYSQRLMHEKQSHNNKSSINNTQNTNNLQVDKPEETNASCNQGEKKECSEINVYQDMATTTGIWAKTYSTSWSTFREIAGLDAYFYLRYIRMCLKITTVSSFWALVILCPVYATGGGDAQGFYHFSMANVLQEDKGRVWVPTIFCWAFTMYCWFCVRAEMMHYVASRVEFLGGEDLKGYGAPDASITAEENNNDENDTGMERNRSRSPLLTDDAEADNSAGLAALAVLEQQQQQQQPSSTQVQNELKQHRYSLQVEKVPIALRSNTALFKYFDDMFPGQVHSACISMNIPDLVDLSARRDRVCRRLEKSLAYYHVTNIRPMHIAGRPRALCCGIESTPIDGWCLSCCCFYDSCQMHIYDEEDENTNNKSPTDLYDHLPEKGERVDSILYYTSDLAIMNKKLAKLQEEKFLIAETGNSPKARPGIIDPLNVLKSGAATLSDHLKEEFEVGEEDYLGGTSQSIGYGAMSRSSPRRAALIEDDHLSAGGEASHSSAGGEEAASSRHRTHYKNRPYGLLRSILWSMGIDFLAAGFDEFVSRSDIVVDSVRTMSSTGCKWGAFSLLFLSFMMIKNLHSFAPLIVVTFKRITPVTIATSAPISYNRNPMQVSIAPEPRDLVWQNVNISADIGANRTFIANVVLGLGVILWSIPLTFIQVSRT